jgi:hypothetical protein
MPWWSRRPTINLPLASSCHPGALAGKAADCGKLIAVVYADMVAPSISAFRLTMRRCQAERDFRQAVAAVTTSSSVMQALMLAADR